MNLELESMILESSEDSFNDLAEKFHSEQTLAFIGSGLSSGAGLPTWKILLNQLAEKINYNNSVNSNISEPEIASTLKDEYEKQGIDFYKTIQEIFQEVKTQPHLVIHEKLFTDNFKCCITTNFDDLLDSAAESLNISNYNPQIWPDLAITRLIEDKVCYLHGALDGKEKIIFTKESYDYAYEEKGFIERLLLPALHENTLIFIGFSFSDTDFTALLHKIESFKKDKMWPEFGPHYALLPAPPDKIYKEENLKEEYKQPVKDKIEEKLSTLKIIPIYYKTINNNNHINLYQLLSYLMNMTTKPEIRA